MHDLTYELKRLAEHHREGSFATQANRKHMLMLFGEPLVAAGYKQMHAPELKGRHINRLLALWREQGVAPLPSRSHGSIRIPRPLPCMAPRRRSGHPHSHPAVCVQSQGSHAAPPQPLPQCTPEGHSSAER